MPINPVDAALGSTMLGELAGVAVPYLMVKGFENKNKQHGHISPQAIGKMQDYVKRKHKLDVGYAHAPLIGRNAGYMTRKDVTHAKNMVKDLFKSSPEDLRQQGLTGHQLGNFQKALENVRKNGLVLTGTNFKKPGTVEHEFGHAIASQRGNWAERGSHAVRGGDITGPIAAAAGELLPHLAGMYVGATKGPLLGMATGLGAGLLANAPTLYSEHAANNRGKEISEELGLRKGPANTLATGSYVAGSVVPAIVSAALMGLGAKRGTIK